jgi:predicted aspartyl protease
MIPVTVIGPSDTRLVTALLDTGADDTIFPEALATRIGVDLSGAPAGTGSGYGMHSGAVRYAEVTLRIADNNERREWQAWVGFTATPLRQPLLGYAGFLQFFDATFRGELEEVELAINGSYRGS